MDSQKKEALLNWLMDRGNEPSTWRGLTWILTAVGITINPPLAAAIAAVGMAAVGIIDALKADEKNRDK